MMVYGFIDSLKVLFTEQPIRLSMIDEGLYLYDTVKLDNGNLVLVEYDSLSGATNFGGTVISYKPLKPEEVGEFNTNPFMKNMTLEDYVSDYISPMTILLLKGESISDPEIFNTKIKAAKHLLAAYYERTEDEINIISTDCQFFKTDMKSDRYNKLSFIVGVTTLLRDSTHIMRFPYSTEINTIINNICGYINQPQINWSDIRKDLSYDEHKEYFDLLFGDTWRTPTAPAPLYPMTPLESPFASFNNII